MSYMQRAKSLRKVHTKSNKYFQAKADLKATYIQDDLFQGEIRVTVLILNKKRIEDGILVADGIEIVEKLKGDMKNIQYPIDDILTYICIVAMSTHVINDFFCRNEKYKDIKDAWTDSSENLTSVWDNLRNDFNLETGPVRERTLLVEDERMLVNSREYSFNGFVLYVDYNLHIRDELSANFIYGIRMHSVHCTVNMMFKEKVILDTSMITYGIKFYISAMLDQKEVSTDHNNTSFKEDLTQTFIGQIFNQCPSLLNEYPVKESENIKTLFAEVMPEIQEYLQSKIIPNLRYLPKIDKGELKLTMLKDVESK